MKRQPPTLRPPPINCSVLASLCDKNVKIDGAAALGQQLDGRQRGRSLARSFVAREPARRRLPSPPPRRLSRTKETTHWGQNSFSVICALIGRRRRKRVCGACRMIGSMSAGAENCSLLPRRQLGIRKSWMEVSLVPTDIDRFARNVPRSASFDRTRPTALFYTPPHTCGSE